MYTVWATLAMVLPVLAGCATIGKTGMDSDAQQPPANMESSVARLTDGRQGFVITEVPQVDEAATRDFQQATAMMGNGQYGQAIELLQKVIEQSPGVTAPYINIAVAYRELDKLEQAEAHLKSALALVPGHPVASNEYGLLYRKTGRFEEARAIYENALALFPEYYLLHRNLGILCDLYLNDMECALEHYEVYSQIKPEDEQVQFWIVDLRNRLESQ